jgi:uncharacterized integral membrane protein
MRAQIVLVAVVVLLTLIFTVANWPALSAPAPINLLVTEVQGPLGLVILGLGAVLIALFVLLVLSLQASVLLETRRQSRELSAQRELADKAEASRFTELRQMLEQEFATLKSLSGQPGELLERLNRLETGLRQDIHDTGNSLSAYIGELEDRLQRSGGTAHS